MCFFGFGHYYFWYNYNCNLIEFLYNHNQQIKNDKNEYLEFLNNFCIGCIIYYTYADYVYINNIYDTPKEHHIHSILKTHPDIYITSLSKLMDE